MQTGRSGRLDLLFTFDLDLLDYVKRKRTSRLCSPTQQKCTQAVHAAYLQGILRFSHSSAIYVYIYFFSTLRNLLFYYSQTMC